MLYYLNIKFFDFMKYPVAAILHSLSRLSYLYILDKIKSLINLLAKRSVTL